MKVSTTPEIIAIDDGDPWNPRYEFVNRIKNSKDYYLHLPIAKTSESAGSDFFAIQDVEIKPHSHKLIMTGIKAYCPVGVFLMLANRSSNPTKKHLLLLNGVGIIDKDYYNNTDNEGEIGFMFYNNSDSVVSIKAGDTLGQGIFMKYLIPLSNINVDKVRSGGFGSTGK